MRRTAVNFTLDTLILFLMAGVISTGLLMEFVLPPGSGRLDVEAPGRGEGAIALLWGLGRHDWGAVHFWLSIALIAGALLHLALHWRWVVAMINRPKLEMSDRQRRRRSALALLGVASVLVIIAAPWVGTVERVSRSAGVESSLSDSAEAEEIRGSMTLQEVSAITGVPVAPLIESLNLPETTSPRVRLGQLRRQHGFTMDDVREAVAQARAAPQQN